MGDHDRVGRKVRRRVMKDRGHVIDVLYRVGDIESLIKRPISGGDEIRLKPLVLGAAKNIKC